MSTATLRKVLAVIGLYRLLLVLSIAMSAVSVVLQLYVPVLFGEAVDGIIGRGNVDFALVAGCLRRILILVIAGAAVSFAMNLINNRLAYHTVRDIRARAIRSFA